MVNTTYGHGFFDDCNDKDREGTDTNSWEVNENLNNMAGGDATLTVDNGDYFKIEAVFDGGAGVDEYCYYEFDMTNISSDVYTQYLIRWKTSDAANGAMAKVFLDFTAGDQTILTSSYSTDWTVSTGTITAGKTIDQIRLYADDDGTDGTFYVYYDFTLLFKNTFTLPNLAYGLDFDHPPKEVFPFIPSKATNPTQHLGTENAVVNIGCDLNIGPWKRTANPVDTVKAETFMDIWHNRSSEPWQWMNFGNRQFKVTTHPRFNLSDNRLDLRCTEFSLGNKSEETYVERFGLNL